MNRDAKRKTMKAAKGQAKQKFTLLELQKAIAISLEMKKESRGHLFSPNLKHEETQVEMCVFDGIDRNTTDDCEFWFLTFLDRVQTILINPEFFIGADAKASWLQHGDEYQDIRIPVEVADE